MAFSFMVKAITRRVYEHKNRWEIAEETGMVPFLETVRATLPVPAADECVAIRIILNGTDRLTEWACFFIR